MGFILYLCLIWSAVIFSLSFISGWRKLQGSFPAQKGPRLKYSLASGTFRYVVGYHNVLWLRSDRDGLHLAISIAFRLGHPDLFIPWSEIEILPKRRFLFFRTQSFILGRQTRVHLRLKAAEASKLLSARDVQ